MNSYTNHDFVEKAFEECDLNHEGRLSYQEFKMWVERTPGILEYLESILPFIGPKDNHPHHSKLETLPMVSMMRKVTSTQSLHRAISSANDYHHNDKSMHNLRSNLSLGPGKLEKKLSFSDRQNSFGRERSLSQDSSGHFHPLAASSQTEASSSSSIGSEEEHVLGLIQRAMEVTQNEDNRKLLSEVLEVIAGNYNGGHSNSTKHGFSRDLTSDEILRTAVAKEGYLWKKGKSILHLWSKRFYLLSGNCMYYYGHQKDIRPKGVIFLTGCLVDRFHDKEMEGKGYWGIELLHQDLCTGEHHRHDKRVLFCKSEEEREDWVTLLQHNAQVVPIEDDYVIGRELGRGRFSTVHECVNKMTGGHYAVKVIDKASIETEEKILLRTEIAVLKLVDHPNIIKMEGLYESRTHIYIVMEKLNGGELFERIVGRPRFSEEEAAKLIRPLLESVAYIHDLGIVHRDLKPENILCGDNLEELKIADFGLSKMVLPTERMDSACGTLSYVAPEVLTMLGYGKEADLWSVGVIMFLVLCGKLPFEGDDQNEIIKSTIQGDLKVNPTVWGKLSDDAKSLITSLLNKNVKDRISAKDALRHPFIISHCPHHKREATVMVSSPRQTIRTVYHTVGVGNHTVQCNSDSDN